MKASPLAPLALVLSLAVVSCSDSQTTLPAPTADPSTTSAAIPTEAGGDATAIPTGATGDPAGGIIDPATVNDMNPDEVADAVATTMETFDTAIDLSSMDGSRRASHWLTPEYAATVAAPIPGGGGADWLDLEAHEGYTTVTVRDATEMGQPEDTATEAYRSRSIKSSRQGRDGWVGDDVELTYFIFLERPDETSPWKVSSISLG